MSNIAIRCEGLGKQYRIGEREQYKALRDVVTKALSAPLRRLRASAGTEGSNGKHKGTFWALKDLSFEIKSGEVVGVIGRNGAGKSTLLKILSRITAPTEGEVEVRGRVGSLLEVGTGFHPELTGRENIYLNGAILGMRRAEIKRKLDDIVTFSGVEKFLDMPVKRYSSGMYVRLAFAVTAHLESEVLIVDEVLAVGDAEFQKKCLGKMQDVAHSGRTVLFVSHNMAAVSNLCSSAMILQNGQITCHGDTNSMIDFYLDSSLKHVGHQDEHISSFRPAWARPWITSARILNKGGQEQSSFAMQSDVIVEIAFSTPDSSMLRTPVMGVVINHMTLGTVGGVNTRMTGFNAKGGPFTTAVMQCKLKELPFLQGQYTVDLWLGDGSEDIDCLIGYLRFSIEESDIYGTGNVPFSHMGVAFLQPEWNLSA